MKQKKAAEKRKRVTDPGKKLPDSIVTFVVRFYLDSGDFNGCPWDRLLLAFQDSDLEAVVRDLVSRGRIELVTEKMFPNPSIKPFAPRGVESQLFEYDANRNRACFYPHPSELAKVVDKNDFDGRPYELALALGAPQLEHRAFDLALLEVYRNDPRYLYECDDVHGWISVRDEHYEGDAMSESDKTGLQTFGFAYNDTFERAVTSFVCYLAKLSPEHQKIWQARELAAGFRMHPDFYRTQIQGEFPDQLPICQALFMELETINSMAEAMLRAPLFRDVKRPKRFGFLLRPTAHEYEQFAHLLDKVISDNINVDFFGDDVERERETPRKDGKVRVEQKGSLTLLDEWVRKSIKLNDWSDFDTAMASLRKVRKARQPSAHKLNDDRFDQSLFKSQRQLLLDAYSAIRLLRLLLANHPQARRVKVDPLLFQGKICDY